MPPNEQFTLPGLSHRNIPASSYINSDRGNNLNGLPFQRRIQARIGIIESSKDAGKDAVLVEQLKKVQNKIACMWLDCCRHL